MYTHEFEALEPLVSLKNLLRTSGTNSQSWVNMECHIRIQNVAGIARTVGAPLCEHWRGALAHLKAVCSSTIVALALRLGVVDNCVPDCCRHQLVSHRSSG
jgi:hypothetical protein